MIFYNAKEGVLLSMSALCQLAVYKTLKCECPQYNSADVSIFLHEEIRYD